ncbi:TPA: hypothetical protein ACN35J_004232 [Vibrio parahaemolyticus]|uniref:hypothetical protein n=1 Tax=Vibrio parahaemolyticus TaxID=670 RepID=UPI00193CB548|nr:hypothetical protein [Vibrio parahaemolyticus]ELA9867053.1 hypothetical protein [Vibrio parahaemolyticus]ELI5382027.1 hypothetical protein [Vibrio parahaemolyticus]MBM5175498.1 hypothetical protein [Vibrio parahaemolyticus]MBM5198170.1 hypothetical protein [Vibrio parahaemolyticus]HCG5255015.1 hypothetical protein [Vibrio parahaemolyticus]
MDYFNSAEFLAGVARDGIITFRNLPVVFTLLAGFTLSSAVAVFVSRNDANNDGTVAGTIFFVSALGYIFATLFSITMLSGLEKMMILGIEDASSIDLRNTAESMLIHTFLCFIFASICALLAMISIASSISRRNGIAVLLVSLVSAIFFVYFLVQFDSLPSVNLPPKQA